MRLSKKNNYLEKGGWNAVILSLSKNLSLFFRYPQIGSWKGNIKGFPSRFPIFVPDYEPTLEKAKIIGKELTFGWNNINPDPSFYKPFTEVTKHRDDALAFALFIFLSAIIWHSEALKKLPYDLNPDNPRMSIISIIS